MVERGNFCVYGGVKWWGDFVVRENSGAGDPLRAGVG